MAPKFDPFTQSFTLHTDDGTPFEVTLAAIDALLQYCIRICINYGAQLGASVVLLIILLLLTRSEKRGSAVFYLNSFALAINIGRLVSQSLYFTTEFLRVYAVFSLDYSRVPQSAYANSVISTVFTTILFICVHVSLVLQVQVVCATFRRRYRHLLLFVSVIVALVPIGFRMAYMIENSMRIMNATTIVSIQWLESSTNIVSTISICFFCTIFVAKLGFAIKLRHRLGVREFGPMKVIFVMGCQTMVIPALFSILQYAVTVPELSSNVLTLVTISLPLSSIWAGTTLDHPNNTAGLPQHRSFWQALSFGNNNTTTTNTNTTRSKQISIPSPLKTPNTVCYADSTRQQEDLECGYGISVEHDISVHSYRKDLYPEV